MRESVIIGQIPRNGARQTVTTSILIQNGEPLCIEIVIEDLRARQPDGSKPVMKSRDRVQYGLMEALQQIKLLLKATEVYQTMDDQVDDGKGRLARRSQQSSRVAKQWAKP